jgi:hypothetical protein
MGARVGVDMYEYINENGGTISLIADFNHEATFEIR